MINAPAKQNTRPNFELFDSDEDRFGYRDNVSYAQHEIEFSTTDTATLQFTTRGPENTGFWIDWGDGTREWVQHLGTGTNVNSSHNYGGLTGTKKITISGILKDVTFFQCADALLGGKLQALSIMDKLTWIAIYNPSSFAGSIDYLARITPVTSSWRIKTYNTAIEGDLGSLAGYTAATVIYVYNSNVGYSTTTLPAWSNCDIRAYDCTWTQSEVDNFLIDLAAGGGSNGTLNIAGTNAARSSASDAAKATLLGNGWSVTVNE